MPIYPVHILVTDDDTRLRELLCRFLTERGYLVSSAVHAADAFAKIAVAAFDLLVLDVMMPGEDGFSLARRLRAGRLTRALPILLLTARGEAEDRISGLETGADDYLVKPFEPRELQLRIEAILRRRGEPARMRDIWLGRWKYDAGRDELQADGETVRLTDAEAALLRVLAEAPNEILSREEMVRRSRVPINDRTVDVQVTRLRRKIEPDPKNPRYLVTIRGEGYRLAPEKEPAAPA